MPRRSHPLKLLVEGATDRGDIAGLMDAIGVPRPDPPDSQVCIDSCGSVDEILRPGVLEAELGASGIAHGIAVAH
ncbi:MAG: hypothetical protein OXH99_12085 [Bryobacterales bacterium]|nr:hypothetical protein [Bryobacterales bacterium]